MAGGIKKEMDGGVEADAAAMSGCSAAMVHRWNYGGHVVWDRGGCRIARRKLLGLPDLSCQRLLHAGSAMVAMDGVDHACYVI
ncbi:hypothetical protein ACLOJK_038206 [Asimina triloba]